MQASLQLMTAGHGQRELCAGRGAWTTPGQWDISRVSMGTEAEEHRLMPAQSSGRLDGESRNENSKRMLVGIRRWSREQSFEHRWK